MNKRSKPLLVVILLLALLLVAHMVIGFIRSNATAPPLVSSRTDRLLHLRTIIDQVRPFDNVE